MSLSRFITGSLTLALAAGAVAIEGPIPLSWRWQGPATFAPESRPLLVDDTVYVAVGQRVYALDAATGAQKWMFPPGETAGDFRVGLAVSGDVIVASSTNNFIYGVNRADGRTLWSFHLGAANTRSTLVNDGTVYVFTTDNRIVALNTSNGQKEWSQDYQLDGGITGEPTFAGGNLIFFSSGRLMGLGAASQRPSWDPVRVDTVNMDGGPFAYGQSVYVVSGNQVAQINPNTGRAGWILQFPQRLHAGVAITDKGGVAVTDDGRVFVFQLTARGPVREALKLNGYPVGSPQVAGPNVVIRLRNGSINVIDPSRTDAPVIWEYTTMPLPGTVRRVGTQDVPVEYVSVLAPMTFANSAMYALAEDGSLFAWGGAMAVDQIGPRITMLSPPQGTVMNGLPDIDFYFRIEDEQTGVMSRSISVTMNGNDMNFEYLPGGGQLFLRIRQPGSTETGANPPLADGRKEIVVTAGDWAGNLSERKFYVTINNTLPTFRERTVDDRTGGAGGGPARGGSLVGGGGG